MPSFWASPLDIVACMERLFFLLEIPVGMGVLEIEVGPLFPPNIRGRVAGLLLLLLLLLLAELEGIVWDEVLEREGEGGESTWNSGN